MSEAGENGHMGSGCAIAVPGGQERTLDTSTEPMRKWLHFFALATVTVILIGLCAWMAVPFLPAITWGVALAIVAWPLHRWIARRTPSRVVAAVMSTTVVVLTIVVPGVFVSYELAREATAVAEHMQTEVTPSTIREMMKETPGLDRLVGWMDRMDVQVETEVRRLVEWYTQDAVGVVQGSLGAALQFLAAIFILYYLFLEHGTFLRGARSLLPLTVAECDTVFDRVAESVHANLYATLVTSLIDSIAGGLMFWAVGLPAPLLWGVIMFVLALIPVLGAAMVWVPAALFLVFNGQWPAALAILAWGLTFFIAVDNILYVRLAGQRMRMHAVPALIAFLGGIAVFGVSGMILGPAILAVTMAFMQVWQGRFNPSLPVAAEKITTESTGVRARASV